MNVRAIESDVTEFLKATLADGIRVVPKIEAMARAARLLGERQSITTTKVFKRAKKSLGVRSLRGWI
jgi:hypothetical protein